MQVKGNKWSLTISICLTLACRDRDLSRALFSATLPCARTHTYTHHNKLCTCIRIMCIHTCMYIYIEHTACTCTCTCICTCICTCTVEDKKTFPFDVLQNGTVCIVVHCVLRNGIKTLQKRYALKTVVERLKNGYGTVVLLLWKNLLARCVRGCGYMHSWSWQRDRDVSIR